MVSAKGLNWQKPETVNLLQMLYVTFEMGITYGELGNFLMHLCAICLEETIAVTGYPS